MNKKFSVAQIKDLLNEVHNEKITFSKFVEIINQISETEKTLDRYASLLTPLWINPEVKKPISTKKLFQLLTIVSGTKSHKRDMLQKLIDIIADNQESVEDQECTNIYQNLNCYKLDLTDAKTWLTFDTTCINLYFFNEVSKNKINENQLKCRVKIYGQDSMLGRNSRMKFEAIVWLPDKFIHNIEHHINSCFGNFLQNAYENNIERHRLLWIDQLKHEILANLVIIESKL